MFKFAIASLLTLCFVACSGGSGGGDGSSTSEVPDVFAEMERSRDFLDEAIALVVDSSIVTCEQTFCSGDADGYDVLTFQEGVVGQGCHIRCLPVEIDESGEVRFFRVNVQWLRLENECFVHEDYVRGLATTLYEEPGLCTPRSL